MSPYFTLLCLLMFSLLNGCLYSCNYAPDIKTFKSTDTCTNGQTTKLVKFIDAQQGDNGNMHISIVMLLPCEGAGPSPTDNYSLAFYDATNVIQPKDLTNLKFPSWFGKNVRCNEKQSDNVLDYINKTPDLKNLNEGAAVTIGVGGQYPNRLYPYYVKIPISNTNAVGKPYINSILPIPQEGACAQGVNMSPFIQNEQTLSPVFQNGQNITTESGAVLLAVNSYQLVQVGAPLFTYGTKVMPSDSNQGLKSSPGQNKEGSTFIFDVKLKPGKYYLVLSKVVSPTAAIGGDFSLSDVKVYNNQAPNKTSNYITDCNYNISSKCSSIIDIK